MEEAQKSVRRCLKIYTSLNLTDINSKIKELLDASFKKMPSIQKDKQICVCYEASMRDANKMQEFGQKLMEALNENNLVNNITFLIDIDNIGRYPTQQKRLYIIVGNNLFKKHVNRSRYESEDEYSGTSIHVEPDPDDLYSKAEVADVLCKLHARLSLLEAQHGAHFRV